MLAMEGWRCAITRCCVRGREVFAALFLATWAVKRILALTEGFALLLGLGVHSMSFVPYSNRFSRLIGCSQMHQKPFKITGQIYRRKLR